MKYFQINLKLKSWLHLMIFVFCLRWTNSIKFKPSPCPGKFNYESTTNDDRWYGDITFPVNATIDGSSIRITLDRPSQLLVTTAGPITSIDNQVYIITHDNIVLEGSTYKLIFMVKFDKGNEIPMLETIHFNGQRICPPDLVTLALGGGNDYSTSRPDIKATAPTDVISDIDKKPKNPTRTTTQATYTNNFGGGNSGNQGTNGYNSGNSNFGGNSNGNQANNGYNPSTSNFGGGSNSGNQGNSGYNPNTSNFGGGSNSGNQGNTGYNPNSSNFGGGSNNGNQGNSGYNPSTSNFGGGSNNGNQGNVGYNPSTSNTFGGGSNGGNQGSGYNPSTSNSGGGSNSGNQGNNGYNPNTSNNFGNNNNGFNTNQGNNGFGTSSSNNFGTGSTLGNNGFNTGNQDTFSGGSSDFGSNSNSNQQNNGFNSGNSNTFGTNGNINQGNNGFSNNQGTNGFGGGNQGNKNPNQGGDIFNNGGGTNNGFTGRPNIGNEATASGQVACGTVSIANPLITLAQNSEYGQWPWHVALFMRDEVNPSKSSYICGGSLVSKNRVITAAHCVSLTGNKIVNPNSLTAYMGKYNINTDESTSQKRAISSFKVNPEYNKANFHNDIAILNLNEDVEYTNYVRPVCLWEKADGVQDVVGQNGYVVGWGYNEHEQLNTELKQATMPIVSTEKCARSDPQFFSEYVSENAFCAGSLNGTGPCKGDSGGGLVVKRNNSWYLRGIVSVSAAPKKGSVCNNHQYIVFTDTAKYTDFIKRNI